MTMELFRIILISLLYFNRTSFGQDYTNFNDNNVFSNGGADEVKSQKLTAIDDNKKPFFKQCDALNQNPPHINEEEEKGLHVTTLTAEDNDPKELGGTVTYKIISRPPNIPFFSIDSNTGEIRTLKPFNRDDPQRELYFDLLVQATDNGIPPLSDICSFKVIIDDINDNEPQLDAQDSTVRLVAEDLKPNSEVMRLLAYDIDSGMNSNLTYTFSDETESDREFNKYFRINTNTGVVYLEQSVAAHKDRTFENIVKISDRGNPPKSITANVVITIVNSDKKPPRIVSLVKLNAAEYEPLRLKEDFHNYSQPLITIQAESNIKDKEVIFELIQGKTAQTNRDGSFVLNPSAHDPNQVYITLGRSLDFETVEKYELTVRVKNKDDMDTTVNIEIVVEDVNDEIPQFEESITGSIRENDMPPIKAMRAQAHDKDGTSPNNEIKYYLISHEDFFTIDEKTGDIYSRVEFDREEEKSYYVTVEARDGSPSALTNNGLPNIAKQKFQIRIEDRNDNPPKFSHAYYPPCSINENVDLGKLVCTVHASDKDTASQITYSIEEGNEGDAFSIEKEVGRIIVKNKLDYEKIQNYTLTVRAFDGIYSDTAKVSIVVENVNDEKPVIKILDGRDGNITMKEEEVPDGCILRITAYDPDINDINADQKILFEAADLSAEYITIEKDQPNEACIRITKPLDADMPFGKRTTNRPASRQIFIYAYDINGAPGSQSANLEITIILEDINDNAPFLNVTEIVWYENRQPDFITELSADDIDGPTNGAPFKFRIAPSAPDEITSKFRIDNERNLYASVTFDRERQKYYLIPIEITDSGHPLPQTGVDYLKVIIGDINDNEAQDGQSEIFVYKYEDLTRDIEIGRVFVEDLDDWDLPDKVFIQKGENYEQFYLSDKDKNMIIMNYNTPEGTYNLSFSVEERSDLFETHTVNADVTVTVKGIPKEAVVKSGSIRMNGSTIEEFVEKSSNGLSKKDFLHEKIARIVNTSASNIDIFTVLPSPNQPNVIDVRFSAHGSPYYAPEKLNNKITTYQDQLESQLFVKFSMVGINECVQRPDCPAGSSCSNQLHIYEEPAAVFTNRTSFVGVKALAEAVCDCVAKSARECYNGGTWDNGICICPSEYEGPNCERLSVGFNGNGWAMYEPFDSCNNTEIVVHVAPRSSDGLVFFAGPLTTKHALLSKEFISLELKEGTVLLKVENGYGIRESTIKKDLNDKSPHKIKITVTIEKMEMEIDDCKSSCTNLTEFSPESRRKKKVLNIYGPLQIGGLSTRFTKEDAKILWQQSMSYEGFDGCISNFSFNGFLYNLGHPSDDYLAYTGCNYGTQQAVTFGIDSNFLVAILVCIAVLIVLLLAVVVHRRQQDSLNEKDIDDTTENIINYEDEGGGECDTNYDLRVFQKDLEEKPIMMQGLGAAPTDISDISGFLHHKKGACDKDPDNMPYDDVRHYAYEGDGNSTGSLSSLGSCTDDGDLDFNYLSSFGKRFSKLADMYDYDGSDSDTQNGGEEAWC